MLASETSFEPSELTAQTTTLRNLGFHCFVNKVNELGNDTVYCFIEGKDTPYYRVRAINCLNKNVHFISCKCKDNVIHTYDRLNPNEDYQDFKKLYFVDRDYDPLMNNPDIFETDGYSVENYYAGKTFVENFLNDFCGFTYSPDPLITDAIMRAYEDWERIFLDHMHLFSCWYKLTKPYFPVKYFEDSIPAIIMKVDKSGIHTFEYTVDDLNVNFPNTADLTQEDIDREMVLPFSLNDVRGKFVLHFMEGFLQFAIAKIKNLKPSFKLQIQSNRKTFLSSFSSCANNSPKLHSYFRSVL